MAQYRADAAQRWVEQPGVASGRRIDAEIVPMTAYDFRGRGQWGGHWPGFKWQDDYRRYARSGPGIVGLSTDIPAQTSRLIKWGIQRQDPATLVWEDASTDAVVMATMRLFRNGHQTSEDLAAEMMRKLDGPGELVSVRDLGGNGHEYSMLNKANVTIDAARPNMVEIRTRPGVERGSHWYREVPITAVSHIHQADEDWPGLPTSQFQRVLPDLEAYLSIAKYLGRNYRSALGLNRVLWAQATDKAQNWPEEIINWGRRAAADTDERNPRTMLPYPLVTDSDVPPELIKVTAGAEQIDVDVADWFLMAFCRGVDFPTKMLFDGPGSANHWGDYVINDYYADFVAYPRAMRVADIWTHHVLRPWGRILSDVWGDRDPDRYRVWPDLTDVRTRTDNTDRILSLGNAGVANRQALGDAAGLRPDQLIDLPGGMTEAEWFLKVNGKTAAGLSGDGPTQEPVSIVGADPRGPGGPPARDANAGPAEPGNQPMHAGLDRYDGEQWDRDADLLIVAA